MFAVSRLVLSPGKLAQKMCEPCGVTSYQPFEGKKECACVSIEIDHGRWCHCSHGVFVRRWNVRESAHRHRLTKRATLDSICKVCPPLGSRCDRKRFNRSRSTSLDISSILPDAELGTELTIRECTPEQACPGNATDADQILADVYPWTIQCTEGYEEKGCAQCSNNYYRLKQQCNICPDTKWESYLILFLMLVGFIMLLPMLVKLLRRFKAISLLFVFVQITAVLSDLDFKWPPIIQNLYKYFAIFTFDIQLLQPECHIPKFDFFLRYFVVVLSPLFFGATFVLITLTEVYHWSLAHQNASRGFVLTRGSRTTLAMWTTKATAERKLQKMKERAKKMITDKKDTIGRVLRW